MDDINHVVSTALRGDAAITQTLLVVLIAAAIFLGSLAIVLIFVSFFNPERSRVYEILGRSSVSSFGKIHITKLLKFVESYITPKDALERDEVEKRLIHAGYRSENNLSYYYGIKILLSILLPVIILMLMSWLPPISIKAKINILLFCMLIGLFLPNYYLGKKITERQQLIMNGFPDALDLLVVCVEAGLGLSAALQRVGHELMISHPLLAAELTLVNIETRAGIDRIEALTGLAKRTGLDEIKGLVSLLGQSITLGSSIADILRIYAEDFRDKRMQQIEEQAAKLSTKMIFPMVFCFFPGFFIVVLGPSVLRLIAAFGIHAAN